MATQVREAQALDQAGLDARVQEVGADVEKQLLALSGLADSLGGEAKAVAAYDAMADSLNALALKYRAAPPSFGKTGGAAARKADGAGMGAMIFGAMVVGAMMPDAVVGSSNDIEPGTPAHEVKDDGRGESTSRMTIDATTDSASMDMAMQTSAGGVTGKLRVQMKVAPCPGPDGSFTATATLTMSSVGAGNKGSNLKIDIKIHGRVDDDAKLVGYDVETTTDSAEFGNGDNKWAEVTDTMSYTGDTMTSVDRKLGRSAGKATAEFTKGLAFLGMLVQMSITPKILAAAQKGWESGRCVALEPTTSPAKRTGLAPSTSVTITAAPRSKVDGAKTGGTVLGTLEGDSSLDPAGAKTPADATFTYVAPGEVGKSAAVQLEARSKRGVAKATVRFSTSPDAYDVSGSIPSVPSGTTFTGRICSLERPFTVTTAGDMVGTVTFTPSGPTGGKLTYKGVVGNAPFRLAGSGTYTVTPPEQTATGTLDFTWRVTIYIPVVGNRTNGGSGKLTLTPTSGC